MAHKVRFAAEHARLKALPRRKRRGSSRCDAPRRRPKRRQHRERAGRAAAQRPIAKNNARRGGAPSNDAWSCPRCGRARREAALKRELQKNARARAAAEGTKVRRVASGGRDRRARRASRQPAARAGAQQRGCNHARIAEEQTAGKPGHGNAEQEVRIRRRSRNTANGERAKNDSRSLIPWRRGSAPPKRRRGGEPAIVDGASLTLKRSTSRRWLPSLTKSPEWEHQRQARVSLPTVRNPVPPLANPRALTEERGTQANVVRVCV